MRYSEYNTVENLAVDAIRCDGRLRGVSEDAVQSILESIRESGFYTRILVRRIAGKGDVLLDGAHRLEAMRRLGMKKIPAVVLDCDDKLAAFLETDANLNRQDLTAIDLAVFLAARRRAYQAMHPETKQGKAGAASRWGQETNLSLASIIAEGRGITPRQVQRIMAAGDALTPDEVRMLRAAPVPPKMKDIDQIGKLADAPTRSSVVDALYQGRARKVSEAIAQLKGPKPQRDPNSAAQEKIAAVWSRLPQAAKRAFVADHADELRRLLADPEQP